MNWYAKNGSGGHGLIIDEADGRTVAVAYDGKDAALLAAAPEMRDALMDIEARLTACARAFYGEGTAKALGDAFKGWKDDIGPARSAIAKANSRLDR
jgi:hypothetical protein